MKKLPWSSIVNGLVRNFLGLLSCAPTLDTMARRITRINAPVRFDSRIPIMTASLIERQYRPTVRGGLRLHQSSPDCVPFVIRGKSLYNLWLSRYLVAKRSAFRVSSVREEEPC